MKSLRGGATQADLHRSWAFLYIEERDALRTPRGMISLWNGATHDNFRSSWAFAYIKRSAMR